MMNDDNRIFELQGKLDKLNMDMDYSRRRCSESARVQFDIGVYGLLHIVTDEELKNNTKVSELLIKAEQKSQERISELQSKLEELKNKVESVKKSKYEMIDKFRKEMEPYKDLMEMHERIKGLKSELETKVNFETDRLVKLPFDAIETVNMLINATYKSEIPFTGKRVDRNVYDIDDLEQIAEHLLVYCKYNKESEE